MAHEPVTIGDKRYIVTHDSVAIILAIQELTNAIKDYCENNKTSCANTTQICTCKKKKKI